MTTTTDLKGFGFQELRMAAQLLSAVFALAITQKIHYQSQCFEVKVLAKREL